MEFPQNLVLEDERVMLRPLQLTDLQYLTRFAVEEPEIWAFSVTPLIGEKGMEAYISSAVLNRQSGKEYPFIVFDKKENRYAGSTRFYDIQQDNLTTQLGYTWYGKEFRRTGLNRHCKFLMLEYAFEKWGMERVEFRADERNERSVNAMKEIGCVVEGVLRSSSPSAMGGRRNAIVLSILRNEWFGKVKDHLLQKIK